MMTRLRALAATGTAVSLAMVLGLASPALAQTAARSVPRALSSADRLSYTTAFDAIRRGDLDAAREAARQAQDRVLLGQVEFERLFHNDHVATYEELVAWLEEYSDLPDAPRVYQLAMRRRPDGAAEPRRPSGANGRVWNRRPSPGGGAMPDDPTKAARIAYNADDLTGAYAMGVETGDWWTAGLAAWRLSSWDDAFRAFQRVAEDPTEDPWVRSAGAFWTARAAGRSGRQDQVQPFLRLAARWPATFYGQIAMRQLGEEPLIENAGPVPYQATRAVAYRPEAEEEIDQRELEAFVRDDPRARRAVAYYEIGRRDEAETELRTGFRTAVDDGARRLWRGLTGALGLRRTNAHRQAERIDAEHYPMPDLQPEGGFVIERALVYAIARKETNFNAGARSGAGAYGMMQVMPATAAEMTGDRGFITDPSRLLQPAVNLRLGQGYVARVLAMPVMEGDLLRAAASYNAGPGPMIGAIRKLGPDADPLLLIETIDVPQARDYVEKVVAAYWIYQRMMGGPLHTLDAVASGATAIPISLDYVPPPPAPLSLPAIIATAPEPED